MLSRFQWCRAVCTHTSAVVTHFPILQPKWLDKFSTCSVFNSSTKSTFQYIPPTRCIGSVYWSCNFSANWVAMANWSDLWRQSLTSCEFSTHRQHNSTVELSCFGSVYWALICVCTCASSLTGSCHVLCWLMLAVHCAISPLLLVLQFVSVQHTDIAGCCVGGPSVMMPVASCRHD